MQKQIIILLSVLLLQACSNPELEEENKQTNTSHESVKVETYMLRDRAFYTEIPANGKITARKQAELFFKTGGTIKEIRKTNGNRVKKDEIIAVLENDLQKNKLQEAENILAKAEIDRSILMVEYDVEKSGKNREKLLQNIDTKSGYLQAQTALEAAQINYDYTFLQAPFGGRIAAMQSETWNKTPTEKFCLLIDDSRLKVEFKILENEFSSVKLGQKISFSPIYNDSLTFSAQISEIDPVVNENGLIHIEAIISGNHKKQLFSGMNVKINILKQLSGVLPVPKNALVKRSGKDVVFSVKNRRAYWNYVEVVGENSDYFAVKKGLSLGDTIIVSNNIQLAHDAKIEVINSNSPDDSDFNSSD